MALAPGLGFRTFAEARKADMTKDEAREAIQAEWANIPLAGRRTEHQAAVFVMKAMPRYEFRCGRDRFHVIMNWLADAA